MKCAEDTCYRQKRKRGRYCAAHAERARLGKDMSEPLRPARGCCMVDGCVYAHSSGGFCNAHYQRHLKSSQLTGPIQARNPGRWGPWKIATSGYVVRYFNKAGESRSQSQHRYNMEVHIGRELLPGENVHHINGQRDDNRIENLELWTDPQPSGIRASDALAWARQVLQRYESIESII